ncbi:MAG: hypothetical protein Q4D38_03955 [Planctomycetia bacterium]|nr:hypothetical protein [Planctomycetia bacterium]
MKYPSFDTRTRCGRRGIVLTIFVVGVLFLLSRELFNPRSREYFVTQLDLPPAEVLEREEMENAGERKLIPGLSEEVLAKVTDNAPMWDADLEAAGVIVRFLKDATLEEIAHSCVGRVRYAHYREQPASYRGNVVRLRGIVRRLNQVKAAKELGVDSLYEMWVQPEDNLHEPIVILAVSIPPNAVSSGDDLHIDIAIDAVFFKNYSYIAGDNELRSAPLFYANAPEIFIDSRSLAKESQGTETQFPFYLAVLIALAGAGIFLLYHHYVTQKMLPKLEQVPEVLDLGTIAEDDSGQKEKKQE